MKNRLFTLILVVVVGVMAGVAIVSRQARDPVLKALVQKQAKVLQGQKRIEEKLSAAQGLGQIPAGLPNSNLAQILQRQQQLEQRIATLESQLEQAKGNPQRPPAEDLSKVYDIEVAHSPVVGKRDAPVTLVEFVDFQCPFCARFHPAMAEAAQAYPDKVNYMVKNFPLSFHPQARPAAKAAFAAGEQGKYAEMVDALLANGKDLSEETYKKLAKDIGLNAKKFWKDYQGKDIQWEKYIEADLSLGAKVNVRGTPTFYINGRKTNARDVASWKREIEVELKKK